MALAPHIWLDFGAAQKPRRSRQAGSEGVVKCNAAAARGRRFPRKRAP